MRIGSLFAGIGGLELGLERAGVGRTVWQVEIDPYCRAVLAKGWPDARRYNDVRAVGAQNLEAVDVICGGFPCQDISYAGKGSGLAGARSGLWYQFARVVGELGPRYVVVENVRALLTRGIDQVLGTLADLGYDAEWSVVSAASVGAPHRRERVFIVAHAQDANGRGEQPAGGAWCWRAGPSGSIGRLGDPDQERQPQRQGAVTDLGRRDSDPSPDVGYPHESRPQGHGRPVERAGERAARTPMRQLEQWADAVPFRGYDGTVRLIPAEAAQAGPESPFWPVAHGVPAHLAGRRAPGAGRVARLRAIGNAVVPACAEVVGRRLMEIVRAAAEVEA